MNANIITDNVLTIQGGNISNIQDMHVHGNIFSNGTVLIHDRSLECIFHHLQRFTVQQLHRRNDYYCGRLDIRNPKG